MHSVFYEPAGPDAFVATMSTIGPWSADAQHGGPPSAATTLDAGAGEVAASTGLAVSSLSDTAGPCGRGMQTLLVAPRGR